VITMTEETIPEENEAENAIEKESIPDGLWWASYRADELGSQPFLVEVVKVDGDLEAISYSARTTISVENLFFLERVPVPDSSRDDKIVVSG